MVTLTLAELYLKQGAVARAREILKTLAAGQDAQIAATARRRLQEIGPGDEVRRQALESLLEQVQRSRRARRPPHEGS